MFFGSSLVMAVKCMSDVPTSSKLESDSGVVAAEVVVDTRLLNRFKTFSIIAIILGGLGLLTCLSSVAYLLMGNQLQVMYGAFSQPGMPPEMAELQQQMQTAMFAVQEEFFAASLAVAVVHFFVALGLFTGGIACLRRVPVGRTILMLSAVVAILFEIGRAVVQSLVQLQVADVMRQYMVRMMETSAGPAGAPPPQVGQFISVLTSAGMMVGLVIGMGFVLIKILFYVATVWHLRNPAVRDLLGTEN
jgi:hypothetical protein